MKDVPFTEARLLSLYDRVAEAEDAIPRLRRFVLDLAVRGKLVPQEAGDEPASVLLDQIEKATRKPTRPQSDDFPFALPSGWSWSDIGGICSKTGSGSTPRGGKEVYTPDGIPFLRSQNVYDHGLVLNDVAYISPDVHERMSGTNVLPRDLLLNITGGSMGRCCRVPDRFDGANVSQHVAILRCAVPEMADFAHALVKSPYFQGFIFGEQTGAGRGGLPKNRMDRIIVAVPPLAEQHRIVAKVEGLMALLDRLEAARAAREETRTRLTAATLSRLTEADADTPTAARFALQTLPALTTRPDQIKSIRQTILNLAVRGKLVEQYPGDEPANAALLQIAKRKEASNLRRPKKVPPITQEERWASTPTGWAWTRWDYITDWITYGFTRPMEHFPSGIPIVTGKNVIDGKIDYSTAHFASRAAFDSLNDKDKPQPGDVLITKDGSIGRTAVVREDHGDFCINQSVAVLWLRSCHLSREYIQLVLDCPQTQQELQARTAGVAIKHISITDLGKMIWPVPPLAEQHRIVAKVEELMSLCDRLERALQDATTTRARLLDATLREALHQTEPA